MAVSAPRAEDGTNGKPGGHPAGVLAAAMLATTGVSFLLVGSAALWLRGESIPVGDADVVIEPGDQNMQRARAALADLAVQPQAVPQAARLASLDVTGIRCTQPAQPPLLITLSRATNGPQAAVSLG